MALCNSSDPRRRQEAALLPHRRRRQPQRRATAASSRSSARYNPLLAKDLPERVKLDADRISHWLSVGAQPSDRVLRFLDAAGIRERAARNNPKKAEPGEKAKERVEERAKKAAEAEAAANAPPKSRRRGAAGRSRGRGRRGGRGSDRRADRRSRAVAEEVAEQTPPAGRGSVAEEAPPKRRSPKKPLPKKLPPRSPTLPKLPPRRLPPSSRRDRSGRIRRGAGRRRRRRRSADRGFAPGRRSGRDGRIERRAGRRRCRGPSLACPDDRGERRIALAAVAGAHGVKGEVRLKLFSDSVESLSRHEKLYRRRRRAAPALGPRRGKTARRALRGRRRPRRRRSAARLAGRDRPRRAAAARRGRILSCRPDRPAGRGRATAIAVGTVVAVENYGAGDLLEIELAGRQALADPVQAGHRRPRGRHDRRSTRNSSPNSRLRPASSAGGSRQRGCSAQDRCGSWSPRRRLRPSRG